MLTHEQRFLQAVLDIGVPILGTLIWACPNSILKFYLPVNAILVFGLFQ